jgi:hypothetical protein
LRIVLREEREREAERQRKKDEIEFSTITTQEKGEEKISFFSFHERPLR